MVRSLEVFLKLWAVCLVFFFLIAVKRELISKSNVAAVTSPLYMAGSRRTDSLELYSTESQTQLDDPPGRAANMEYEVGYTNHFCTGLKRRVLLLEIFAGAPAEAPAGALR